MPKGDNALETALWLVAGGAAGYAAGRFIVGPHLAKPANAATRAALPRASSGTAHAATLPAPKATPNRPQPIAGPPKDAMPIDPYTESSVGAGPSGQMQPIDPYVDAPPNTTVAPSASASTPTVATAKPTTSPKVSPSTASGPITRPSQLVITSTGSIASPPSASGPITRPSQVDARPTVHTSDLPASSSAASAGSRPTSTPRAELPRTQSASFATSPQVRRFDPVFERFRRSLPIEYVRALVERESNGQPSARTGSAIGLMQIVPVVLADYNKRHGAAVQSEQLADPATNVAIGCELLRLIVDSYRRNHPRITTLQADWNNPQFVELLTFGWNAGFSEAGGVGRVARYLEGLGAVDVTLDQVTAHAGLAGASKHLSNPAKVAWCKSVVALYQRERALARSFAAS